MIKAEIICDSVNPVGVRLTTAVLTYPRFIHSEIMTHRALSKNSASSRAIPIEKMIASVLENPAMPEFWAQNQKGMQASAQVENIAAAKQRWLIARDAAVTEAQELSRLGLHKAIVNRVLEPFMHMTVIATGDQFGWANLFSLRAHPAAQQEFQVLAFRMLAIYQKNEPKSLKWGDWHMPWVDFVEEMQFGTKAALKISTARCARVSYTNHGIIRNYEEDEQRHDDLANSRPVHASAFEHCAQARDATQFHGGLIADSNFDPSWLQYRKTIKNETAREINPEQIMATKPEWIQL